MTTSLFVVLLPSLFIPSYGFRCIVLMQQSMFNQGSLFGAALLPNAFAEAGLGSQSAWDDVLASPLETATFTVIDLETTGLSAKRNSITELTAIQYVNGQQTAIYSTLVQPKEPIPPEVEDLTGISNEMVRTAPPVVMVLNELFQTMGPTPLIVGHNVSFDLGFLREKCQETGLLGLEDRLSYERSFCTKVLAQKVMPGLPSYEGIVVATQCGYHNDNPHRAEADVRMSAAILFTLISELQNTDHTLQTVGDLLAFQGPLQAR
jgi:DNA polymerase III epsilon subunit family exonuclease